MISRIARLRAKKGFTLIELIVVIAIIGILTAMIVPTLAYNNKPAIGKSMAKEMFYRSQEVLSDCKAVGCTLTTGYNTCFFAEIDDRGEVITTGAFLVEADGTIDLSLDSGTSGKIDDKMDSMMRKYLSDEPTENMAGHIVVACDPKFRVLGAYWLENFDWHGNVYFSDEYILSNGEYCSAYPAAFCAPGHRTFVFTNALG